MVWPVSVAVSGVQQQDPRKDGHSDIVTQPGAGSTQCFGQAKVDHGEFEVSHFVFPPTQLKFTLYGTPTRPRV